MVGGDRRAPDAADSTVKVGEGEPWGQWYKKEDQGLPSAEEVWPGMNEGLVLQTCEDRD